MTTRVTRIPFPSALLAALLLLPVFPYVGGDPVPGVDPWGPQYRNANWSFDTPGNYTRLNTGIATGDATLLSSTGGFTWSTDADFAGNGSVDNATIAAGGVRLAGDASRLARSVEAAATNPAAVGLVERSGLVDKLALTLQGQKLFSADETAVTLNLNALALLGRPEQGPARPGLSRLGGSVTFGAKLPQKEIVGFSGLPDADKLLDVLSWDVKLRLWGDRDPRAREWARYQWADTAMLQLDAIAPADLAAVQSAIQELGNDQVERGHRPLDPGQPEVGRPTPDA